jgi:hypothetical protein
MFGYGKIFGSFFDSSVNDVDPITRLVFIAMIVLSDATGKLDVTRQALARRVNVTTEDVDRAIEILSQPDALSRSSEHEGRRLMPIDPSRSWGWVVVNKAAYRGASDEEKREQARERKRRERDRNRKEKPVTEPNTYTGHHSLSLSRHALSRPERDARFEDSWSKVPRKEGKIEARRHWDAKVQTPEDADRFDVGIEGYRRKLTAEGTAPRFMLHGSTLFFNIEDYVEWQPPDSAKKATLERPEGLQGVAV